MSDFARIVFILFSFYFLTFFRDFLSDIFFLFPLRFCFFVAAAAAAVICLCQFEEVRQGFARSFKQHLHFAVAAAAAASFFSSVGVAGAVAVADAVVPAVAGAVVVVCSNGRVTSLSSTHKTLSP